MKFARPRTLFVALTALLLLTPLMLATPARAGFADQPAPQSGFTHSPYGNGIDTPQGHGLRLSGEKIVRSSPTIGEIDGNNANGKEITVGGKDGRLYVRRANGTEVWTRDIPGLEGCLPTPEAREADSLISAAPAVGDIDGDGTPDVVVGYGSALGGNSCPGGVVAYDGPSGALLWNFQLRQQPWSGGEALFGVWSSPALADTNGDGKMEIAFGGFDRNFYLLNFDGSIRFAYHAADTIWSSPVFANVDSDAQLEIVFATDITANPVLIPPTLDGGFIQAFDTHQRNPVYIGFQQGADTGNPPWIWRTFYNQALYSSPAIGDILPASPGQEIAIGTSCYVGAAGSVRPGPWVKVLSLASGAELQTLSAPECVESSPALGDLDNDGNLEVVANVGWQDDPSIPDSRTIAWEPAQCGNPCGPKWQTTPYSANFGNPGQRFNDPSGGNIQSPVIADIDGNGSLEVITANYWSVVILNANGQQITCIASPECGATPSLYAWGTVKATPAVADMDNDGDLEVALGGWHIFQNGSGASGPYNAHLYVWTNLNAAFNTQAGPQDPYSAPWPMFRRTPSHDARLIERALVVSPPSFNVLIEQGTTKRYGIALASADGSNLAWTLSETSDPDDIVSVSTGSGSTGANTRPTVTIDARGLASGSYTASLRLSSSGLPNQTITFNVEVVDTLNNVYLPTISR